MTNGSSRTDLSRRERERLMRRRAMLRAAQAVFAEKGYSRATLDEIADRAEFGKGTLYNYFEGGKEEILFAVFEDIYDDICALIRDVFGTDGEPERPLRTAFHAFVEAFFEYSQQHEDLIMILVKETHRLAFSEDAARAAFFQKQRDRMVHTLVPALEQAMDRGEIRRLPPVPIAHMLLANVNGIVVHRCLADRQDNGCDEPIPDQPDQAADFLTTMLFDGLAADSSSSASTAAPLDSNRESDDN